MKNLIYTSVIALMFVFNPLNAQPRYASADYNYQHYDLSDNLDLEAVSYIFADSRNLKDFEYKLNSPEYRITNLDIDRDGYVDYLRVLESPMNGYSVIFIQAMLGYDIVQDVATIEVRYLRNGDIAFQVIGDEYLFGQNYIVEPVFHSRPGIAVYFHLQNRTAWHSPYHWNRWPTYYSFRRPVRAQYYHLHVSNRFSLRLVFSYPVHRHFRHHKNAYKKYHRHDYAKHHRDYAFERRNKGFKNKHDRREKYDNRRQGRIHNNSNTDYRANSKPSRKSQRVRSDKNTDYRQKRNTNSNVQVGNARSDYKPKNQKSTVNRRIATMNRSRDSKPANTNYNSNSRNNDRYKAQNSNNNRRNTVTNRSNNSKSTNANYNKTNNRNRNNSTNRTKVNNQKKRERVSVSSASSRRSNKAEPVAQKQKLERKKSVNGSISGRR